MPSLPKSSNQLFSLLIALAGLALGSQLASAENPEAIRQLLQTNSCENCDLSGANLAGLNLTGANLQGANLQGAQLSSTNLSRADLRGANLQDAEISRTTFQGANLQDATLANAQVSDLCRNEGFGFNLTECVSFTLIQTLGSDICDDAYGIQAAISYLDYSDDLIGAMCLDDSEINSSEIYGLTSLWGSLAFGNSMLGANLQGADLSGINLGRADLRHAQLAMANLQDTNLTYTLLMDAELDNVQNANFDQAFLTKADVGQTLVQLFEQQTLEARRYEGESHIRAMKRAQMATHIETGQFAAQLEELQIGIPLETEAYRYEILQVTETFVVHQAIPLQEGLNSYLGFVYLALTPEGGDVLETLLCESADINAATLEPIAFEPPTSSEVIASCPKGWVAIR